MKYCLYSLLCARLVLAQSADKSTTSLYVPDLNGNRVEAAVYTAKDGDRRELTQSINGREVPLQRSDTHVLNEGPNGRTTETLTHKYDATGQAISSERTVVEERKTPGGTVIHSTVYRSDLNGQLAESERRTIETQTQGSLSTTNVTISRPGLSGSFDVAEKRNVVTNTDGKNVHETEVVQVPAANGRLMETVREVREKTIVDGATTSTSARYEPDFTGGMSLASQQVATTKKAADGSVVTEVNLYAPAAYGIAREQNATAKLREQEVTVRREKNGVVTETTTASRPTLQDPNRLGPPASVSELVCKGKCDGPLKP